MNQSKLKKAKLIASIVFLVFVIAIFAILLYDMRSAIIESFKTWSYGPIEEKMFEYRENNTFLGYFIIALCQSLLIVFMIPAEGIQVIGAICFGKWIAFFACMIGVFLGNFIIYLLVRKIGKNIIYLFKKKHQETYKTLEGSKRVSTSRITFGLTILYFIPGIPYGLIAITAASTKLKFPRYILITTLCSIPSIALSILFGTVVTEGNIFWTIFIICLMVVATALSVIFRKKLINFFTNRQTKGDMEYFRSNPGHLDKVFYFFFYIYIKLFVWKKYHVKFDKTAIKDLKGPYVLVHNHESFFDFAWCYGPLYPQLVHSVMAYNYFCNSMFGRILHNHVGAFPKMLFSPDISAIKNIKRVIKDDGIVTLAPEGRLSPHGALESINTSTIKLLKNLGVPVVIAKVHGAYLSIPKWAKKKRIGRIDVNYNVLFTKDEITSLDDEVLYQKLYNNLNYDEFAWQKENKQLYKCNKMAEGLEGIIYICPKCHKEFTLSTHKNSISCSHCGFEASLDNYYDFHSDFEAMPNNIKVWFDLQKEIEKEKIYNQNYTLNTSVTLKMPDPNGHGLVVVGTGEATLTSEGFTYKGTINNEEKEIVMPIDSLPALPFGANEDFEFYANNTFYYFIPKDPKTSVKWSIVAELFHLKYIEDNSIKLIR